MTCLPWRSRFALLLCLLLLDLSLVAKPLWAAEPPIDAARPLFVPNQLIVKLNVARGATLPILNARYGTRTLKTLPGRPDIHLLGTPAGADVATLLEEMGRDADIIFAEPNYFGEAPERAGYTKWAWAGTDPTPMMAQYATTLLKFSEVHTRTRGAGTIVAVLDTGLQLDHVQFTSSLTGVRHDFVADDRAPDEAFVQLDADEDGYVDALAGHGTHVAGIVHLAAPEAKIMPLRVLDATGRGTVFQLAAAILYAAQNGADVINLSLVTTGKSTLLAEVINSVGTTGNVVIVAAAGNTDSSEPVYPAAEEAVVAVTAVDARKRRANLANYGPWVDVAAPGDDIDSTFPVDGYAYWSGTSMATPLIAAQAALLRSYNPGLSSSDVRTAILSTAQPLGPNLGAGLTNFVASLDAVQAMTTTLASDQPSEQAVAGTVSVAPDRLFLPFIGHTP